VNLGLIMSISWSLAWPPVWAVCWRPLIRCIIRREPTGSFWGQWVSAAAWTVGTQAFISGWGTAVAAVNLVFGAVMWWLSRRRRKRAPRAYGAKSRALLAAVVAKMREAAKPRPVFKPVPGRA